MKIAGLFVGVSRLADPGITELQFAHCDATALHAVFADSNASLNTSPALCRLLVNAEATKERVLSALSEVIADANSGNADLVIVHLGALARTVRLPSGTIDQLRASELDPFATSFEDVAYLGYVLGLAGSDFSHLISIDHSRFARHVGSVFARSGQGTTANAVARVEQLWHRFAEDRATEL